MPRCSAGCGELLRRHGACPDRPSETDPGVVQCCGGCAFGDQEEMKLFRGSSAEDEVPTGELVGDGGQERFIDRLSIERLGWLRIVGRDGARGRGGGRCGQGITLGWTAGQPSGTWVSAAA